MRFVLLINLSLFISWVDAYSDLTMGPLIIDGQTLAMDDYPAVVRSIGQSPCTATLVGPRAILTAAHCLGDSDTELRVVVNRMTMTARCLREGGFHVSGFDLALCKLNQAVSHQRFEQLDFDRAVVPGDALHVLGYGCTEPSGLWGATLRGTFAEVLAMPSTGLPNSTYIRSSNDSSAGVLCHGDSGGPAFFLDGEQRSVVAVNSATSYRNGLSRLTTIGSPEAKAILERWANEFQITVLGLNLTSDCSAGFFDEACENSIR